jgi:hypothetical protein
MASTFPTSLDTFTNPTAASLLTSPSHALQHSDINDAVEALQTKVAIGNTVLGTYISVTPTFPSGLTLGNGTVTGQYSRVNNFVHYWGRVVWGTTTSLSAAGLQVSLPVSCDSTFAATAATIAGFVGIRDVSAGVTHTGVIRPIEGFPTTASLAIQNIVNTYTATAGITSTAPMTWASTDIFVWSIFYKAA